MKRTALIRESARQTVSVTRFIPKDAKVGLFPLHLDPPTVYHQQLFKTLVAAPESLHLQRGGGSRPLSSVQQAEAEGHSSCHTYASGAPASAEGSSPIYNPGSTTVSPYGDDWDTEALSRFARRRRLLSLLKEYKRYEEELLKAGRPTALQSLGRSASKLFAKAGRSNRNQDNYINLNTIKSRAAAEEEAAAQMRVQTLSGGGTSAGGSSTTSTTPDDYLSEDEIVAQLKQYVVKSWQWSRRTRTSAYGGLATALRDEIFLDSAAFGVAPTEAEHELLSILHEQHLITEEAYSNTQGMAASASTRRDMFTRGLDAASQLLAGKRSESAAAEGEEHKDKEGNSSNDVTVGHAGVFHGRRHGKNNLNHKGTHNGGNGGDSKGDSLSHFTPYDLSQAHSRQLLHKRRLPCQTAAEISKQARHSIANSKYAPFDHLIVLPNSKYPAPIQQSRHLAAMASLSVRNLHPRVHMELYLLEHPEHADTVMKDLTSHFTKSTIIHWLPNITDVQMWQGYTDMMSEVPVMVLRPKGFQFHYSVYGQNSDGNKGSSGNNNTTQTGASSDDRRSHHQRPASHRFSHRHAPSAKADSSSPSNTESGGDLPTAPKAVVLPDGGGGDADCSVSSSPSNAVNAQMARALKSRLNATQLEIVEVERLSGAGVRQLLWDRGTRHEEHGVIPPVVLRYMDSHGLYRDFRKGFAQSEQTVAALGSSSHKDGKLTTSSFQATVALASLIPRLEIHYDRANLLAREQYEKLKNFECKDGQDPDLIVPIGGDGYMMHCIRNNWHRFVPFFGVNAGHRGYLLNEPKRLEELFSYPLKLYHMPMLYCEAEVAVVDHSVEGRSGGGAGGSAATNTVAEARKQMAAALRPSLGTVDNTHTKGAAAAAAGTGDTPSSYPISGTSAFLMGNTAAPPENAASPIFTRAEQAMAEKEGRENDSDPSKPHPNSTIRFETRTELAFNDAWIDRATGQTAWIRVFVNNTEQLKRVRGDGVLVSTAAGSTAYAQALGASPIPADVQLIQLVGSNIVSPSRWRPVHLNQSDSVTLEVIDNEKRPCKCFVDSNCLGIAKSLKVRTSRVASVQLAFCHSYDLQQKLYQVQFPKEDEW